MSSREIRLITSSEDKDRNSSVSTNFLKIKKIISIKFTDSYSIKLTKNVFLCILDNLTIIPYSYKSQKILWYQDSLKYSSVFVKTQHIHLLRNPTVRI